MNLKSIQYIEKTGGIARVFLFLLSIYNLFKFTSLENEGVEVLGVLPFKTYGDVKYIEGDDLSANCKFLIDRTTHWLG